MIRTIAFDCEHPPLASWPMRSLITGTCPACSASGLHSDKKFARVIRARKMAGESR